MLAAVPAPFSCRRATRSRSSTISVTAPPTCPTGWPPSRATRRPYVCAACRTARLDDGTIDEDQRISTFGRQGFEYPATVATLTLTDIVIEKRCVRAIAFWQVPPGCPSSKDVEDAIQDRPVVTAGRTAPYGGCRGTITAHITAHSSSPRSNLAMFIALFEQLNQSLIPTSSR